ncbi:MAG: nucleotidyltransferase domain-containing protein [Steroidobacteraceae bacterium]|nr:nucleotidyltransferase domain-containing protein [Deltaproteobacteria bacterium]
MGSLDDLKNPVEKDLLIRCKRAIRSIDPTADVILFGSRARGDADDDSDYDLLILTDGDSGLKREEPILRALFPIELETGAVLTFLLYNKLTWDSDLYRAMPFHRNVDTEGIAL